MFSSSTFTVGSPRMPSVRPWVYFATSAFTVATGRCRAAATRLTWMAAFCGEMPGSRPEPEAVTASGGICDTGTWSNAAMACCRCLISLTRAGLFGPRLDAAENSGLQPLSVLDVGSAAADGRGWKYCGSGLPLASLNSWQSRLEPTTRPWDDTIEPLACRWKASCEMPTMTAG